MATNIETKRKLRAIRRLSASFPDRTADERLATIEGIASGKVDPSVVRHQTSPDLLERLERGRASRSRRNALDTKPAEEKKEAEEGDKDKKRGRRGGRDRQEHGGFDRSADLNT